MRRKTIVLILVLFIIIISSIALVLYSIGNTMISNIDIELVPEGRIKNIEGSTVTLILQVRFVNKGDISTPKFSATYKLYINNTCVGDGYLPWVNIPAKTSTTSKTIIKINLTKLGKAVILSILNRHFILNVTIQGKVYVEVFPGILLSKDFEKTETIKFI